MIYGDISEKKYVHELMKKKFGDEYERKELGTKDGDEFIRFADFEIGEGRAFIERKTAADFLSSRRDRLYKQLDKMDKYVSGRKILILEGTKRDFFSDSKSFFSNYDKRSHDLRGLSPLEQCVDIAKNTAWTYSFMRECFMRDIWFLQTIDLEETAIFLDNMNEGFDETPKLRLIPKRIAQFSTAQTILATVPKIGKVTSGKLLGEHGTLDNIIDYVKEMPAAERTGIYQNLYDAFCKKPRKVIK